MENTTSIDHILQQMPSISLSEMGKVKLMKRTDTKYVTTLPRLLQLLQLAKDKYMVQVIDGMRNMPYSTCYFDTASCDMYHQHQRGRKARQKVRLRVYEQSNLAFLEIKDKNNRGRTHKKRVEAKPSDDVMQFAEFIATNSHYNPEELMRQLYNHFTRITLVNSAFTERLTIDTNLSFHNAVTGDDYPFTGLVIIELKRDGNVYSPILSILRSLHINPSGFSKYCMGMALTNKTLPTHRIKAKLRTINKMLHHDNIN